MKVLEIKFQTAASPGKLSRMKRRQHARLNLSATSVPHFSRRTVGVAFVTRIMVWSGEHMAEKRSQNIVAGSYDNNPSVHQLNALRCRAKWDRFEYFGVLN
jgi:hypothetical protein